MTAITTAQTGPASSTSSWVGGVVPGENDSVTVAPGHTLTLDGTYIWGDDTTSAITVNGTLKASRSVNSKLTCKGHLTISSGGYFDRGTVADPIPSGVIHELVLNYSATLAAAKWGMTVSTGNPGGKFSAVGATRTVATTTSADIAAADGSFTATEVTGWLVGDDVYVGSSNVYGEAEKRTISAINGSVVSVSGGNFTYAHAAGVPVVNSGGNVLTYAYHSSHQTYIALLMTNSSHAADSIEIKFADFKDLTNLSSPSYNGLSLTGSATMAASIKEISNTSFSRSAYGLDFSAVGRKKTMTNLAFGGTTNAGVHVRQGSVVSLTTPLFVKNSTNINSSYSQGAASLEVTGGRSNGTSTNVFSLSPCMGGVLDDFQSDADNQIFSVTQTGTIVFNRMLINKGPGAPKTTTVVNHQSNAAVDLMFADCQIEPGSYTNLNLGISGSLPSNRVTWANKNVDPSQQEVYKSTGTLLRDNSTYRSTSPSVRVDPLSSTDPFSFSVDVFAPTGKPVVVSGYLRKNSAYGSNTLPSVTLSGLGITPSTFTIADVNDAWQQFAVQGTQETGTDGMVTVTFSFQSNGSGAQAWLDDVVAPVASSVNVGDFGYWSGGLPVQAVLANFVAPLDVWNIPESQLTLVDSIGAFVRTLMTAAADFNSTQKASLNAATPAAVQNIAAQTGDTYARIGAAGAGLTALSVDLNTIKGQAVTCAAGVTVHPAIGMSDTAQAAIEDQYDGTGLSGGTYPATQAQVANIANTGSAEDRFLATSYTLTRGTQTAGTFESTWAEDVTGLHKHTDVGGVLDLYYETSIGGGSPNSVAVTGYLNGGNDDLYVQGFNEITASWVTIGTMSGALSTVPETRTYPFLVGMVGTGANLGRVRVRFWSDGFTLTSATLAIDQILFSAYRGMEGYEGGSVWLDTVGGQAGTIPGINGTLGNACLTLADARTIMALKNFFRLALTNQSSITLASASDNLAIDANGGLVALGGQSISGSTITGGRISGVGSGSGIIHLNHCVFEDCSPPPCRSHANSHITGTVTLQAGEYVWTDAIGSTTAVIDFGAAVGATSFYVSPFYGHLMVKNLKAGDICSIDGSVHVTLDTTCTGGIFHKHRNIDLIDNSGGAVAVLEYNNAEQATALAIKAKTDLLPGSPAATSDIPSAATIAEAVWAAGSRTLTSLGSLASDIATAVWGSVSRTLTAFDFSVSANVDEEAIATAVVEALPSPIVVSAAPGSPSSIDLTNRTSITLKCLDTYRLTFSLGIDFSGEWVATFAAKRAPGQAFSMTPRSAVWVDAAIGSGYVDLSSTDTAEIGQHYAELKITRGAESHTPRSYGIHIVENYSGL